MNPQALGIIDMKLKSDDEMSDESDEIIDEEVEKELKGTVKKDMDDGRSDGMSARDGAELPALRSRRPRCRSCCHPQGADGAGADGAGDDGALPAPVRFLSI